MPYIILKQQGFENFTGMFGGVQMKNGRSVEPISSAEAVRLASITYIETEEGVNPSATQVFLDHLNVSVDDLPKEATLKKAVPSKKMQTPEKTSVVTIPHYTKADLEEIADCEGVAGLRTFAAEYGIKSRSIQTIISDLMTLKAALEAEAEKSNAI